ncbi:MAG: Holliday junction branch migration protein RuvA [Firmicutes bacterium]|nr:Holliday junction branch migration protein RuvA [Bacillota bacterium]
MLHYIRGRVTGIEPGMVVIESNGIGYEVNVPEGSRAYLASPDEEIVLYTAMMVREDDVSLYGFTDRDSLAMFRLLQTVSGVGAKAAIAILSVLNPQDLRKALFFEDVALISRANGVGKKTAQRLCLELKDKVGAPGEFPEAAASAAPVKGSARDEALQALVALGYSRSEALGLMSGISEEDLTSEEYIRRALRARR